jgi:SM-20-related protein
MLTDVFSQIPRHGLVRDWLGSEAVKRLLSYAQSNEHRFKDSPVGDQKTTDHTRRHSIMLRQLDDDIRIEIEAKVQDLLPMIFDRLGNTPFIPSVFEFQLVAHGDGAFFCRHIDTYTKYQDQTSKRAISMVYYFHASPKAFSGGVLRLHCLAASDQPGTFVDIKPECDTLVFFPSWFPHEVLPVNCPSGRFLDSRFAINCWIRN